MRKNYQNRKRGDYEENIEGNNATISAPFYVNINPVFFGGV